MSSRHFDVIVSGVGSMGSSAVWWLARRGYKVLGIEQFDIPHTRGSHAGQSRIIRQAYYEHPDYVPLLQRAYHDWNEIEKDSGCQLFYRTGILYLGEKGNETLTGVGNSAKIYDLKVQELDSEMIRNQYPVFKVPDSFYGLIEPEAGFVLPEKTIQVYTQEAIKKGAVIHQREKVRDWHLHDRGVTVSTNSGTYTADRFIITAGAWSLQQLPDFNRELKITQQVLAWVNPSSWNPFTLGNFPCWFIEDPVLGTFYGFPLLSSSHFGEPVGLKLARHFPGQTVDPDQIERTINDQDIEDIRHILRKYLPGAGTAIREIKTCLYSNSSDGHFIVDHLPGYDRKVIFACGFSGHGFKFVPVIGEILADLAMDGSTDLPVSFLSLNRFEK